MASPSSEQIRLMQMLGLFTMAVIFGVRLVPPLQPHARLIGMLATGLYLFGGVVLLLWYFLGH